MTKKHTKFAFACLSALLICAGCVEENLDEQNRLPALDGDEITFGARAGFENSGPNTKTIYGGEGDFGYYTDNGRVIESIRWNYDTDKIQIYCPESESTGFAEAHYKVLEGQDNTGNTYSYLQKTGDASIRWANETTPHNFYAMYPSNEMFEGDEAVTLKSGVKMVGTTLTATIPVSQSPEGALIQDKRKDANGNETEFTQYTAKPNMNFAYMAAKTTGVTKLDKDGNVQGVSLTFVPIVTAVQIELSMPYQSGIDYDNINIGEIYIEGTNIAGDFTADLQNWDPSSTSSPYPSCTNVSGSNKITVSTWQVDENNNRVPLSLKDGESLVFTVFLSPAAGTNGKVNDLKVTYSEMGGNGPSKTMKDVNIKPHIKTVVKAFKLPDEAISVDNSRWVEVLPDDVEMEGLSIPGTGNSFSYSHTDEDLQAQTLTFDQQWNLGIRAFEVSTCRDKSDFGNQEIICNGEIMTKTVDGVKSNLTVNDVFSLISDKLSVNENEFAMVILNYKPYNSYSRNAGDYAQKVVSFYDKYTSEYRERTGDANAEIFKMYSPHTKLSDVRGKIMLIMRTNQEDEDPATDYTAVKTAIGNKNILAVDGCGSAKDKWGRRGYSINGKPALNIWDSDGDITGELVENYMIGTSATNNVNDVNWEKLSSINVPADYSGNFSYNCTTGNNESFKIWYQEWSRIVPNDINYYLGSCRVNEGSIINTNYVYTYYYIHWFESYTEKINHAKSAFIAAINGGEIDSDGNGKTEAHVFINSLCGYFVDSSETYNNSCIPYISVPDLHTSHGWWGSELSMGSQAGGEKGNIGALATKINNDFYNYVLQAGLGNSTGPTGVVMMDRVSNKAADGGSYYLPGVIIGNNFKY